jgi:nucleotide-binding universal stress UspA family protein
MPILAEDLRVKSVLVATDFSETSQKAVRHAVAIARHFEAKLYLVNVVCSLGFTLAGPDAMNAATEAACRDGRHLETQLLQSGALKGLQHEITVHQGGDVWRELNKVIRKEDVDLVVTGTHARRGVSKVLLGSVAEQIFRRADCPVLTVGPSSYDESRVHDVQTCLFPTDFSEASLRSLPNAIAYANQLSAKLVLLHVLRTPAASNSLLSAASLRQLQELPLITTLDIKPEFLVEFCPVGPISAKILQTAARLGAELIILGLRRFKHAGPASHMPWATAYEIVCGAGCGVLTVRL